MTNVFFFVTLQIDNQQNISKRKKKKKPREREKKFRCLYDKSMHAILCGLSRSLVSDTIKRNWKKKRKEEKKRKVEKNRKSFFCFGHLQKSWKQYLINL